MITLRILVLLILCTSISGQSQEIKKNLKKLENLVGEFSHRTKMYPPGREEITENGSIKGEWYLGDSYIKIEAILKGNKYTRYYSQMITFDPQNKKFRSTYFYNGTSQTVTETGVLNKNKLVIKGKNPFSEFERNGINIRSEFDLSDRSKIVLKVFELNKDGDFKLGYHSVLTRITARGAN